MSDEPWRSDDVLAVVRQRLNANEEEVQMIALELEFDASVASLCNLEQWKLLQARLEGIIGEQTERLLNLRMDGQALGKLQGFIRALRVLAKKQPMPEERIANLKERATFLVDRIREDRQLLA